MNLRLFTFLLLGITILFIGSCDTPLNESKEKNLIPKSGKNPLPFIAGSSYITRAETKGDQLKNEQLSINWETLKPLLIDAQEQTGHRHAAIYSVSDSSKGVYYYQTAWLKFSPQAVEAANGTFQPFFFESGKSHKPDNPVQVLAAYIPKSDQAEHELQRWIYSKAEIGKSVSKSSNKRNAQSVNSKRISDEEPCYFVYVHTYPNGVRTITIQFFECTDPTTGSGGDTTGGGDDSEAGDTGIGGSPGDVPCSQQLIPTEDCSDGGPGGGTDDGVELDFCQLNNPPEYCSEPEPCETSAEEIGDAFPNALTDVKDELESAISEYGEDFGIDTKEELQHFLAQAGHESGGFSTLEENLEDYTVANLRSVFGKYFNGEGENDPNKKNPSNYVGDEEKIANYVYANRNGNGNIASGDGYKYRGRGIIQLTGRANYKSFTDFYQDKFNSIKDFENNPGLIASDEEIAVISAMHFFKENVLDEIDIDENTTVKEVTEEVNGGTNGLDDRKTHYQNVTDHITDCNK